MTAVDAAVPVSHAPIQNGIVVFGLIAVTLASVRAVEALPRLRSDLCYL